MAQQTAQQTFLQVLEGTIGSQGFQPGDIFVAEHYGTSVEALVKAKVVKVISEEEALAAAAEGVVRVALEKAPTDVESALALRPQDPAPLSMADVVAAFKEALAGVQAPAQAPPAKG